MVGTAEIMAQLRQLDRGSCLDSQMVHQQGHERASWCEQNTHSTSMYRYEHTEQSDHISSREHVWLKSWNAQDRTSLCPKTFVIHVSCLIPCRT